MLDFMMESGILFSMVNYVGTFLVGVGINYLYTNHYNKVWVKKIVMDVIERVADNTTNDKLENGLDIFVEMVKESKGRIPTGSETETAVKELEKLKN